MTIGKLPPHAKWQNCYFWFDDMVIYNTLLEGWYMIRRSNSGMWKAARFEPGMRMSELQFHNIDNTVPVEKHYQEYLLNKTIEDSICQ